MVLSLNYSLADLQSWTQPLTPITSTHTHLHTRARVLGKLFELNFALMEESIFGKHIMKKQKQTRKYIYLKFNRCFSVKAMAELENNSDQIQ